MNKSRILHFLFAGILITGMTLGSISMPIAYADTYPSKPVTVIVSHRAGGSTDLPARLVQPFLEKYLGVPVVVQNKTGAGGSIARVYVMKQKPDGYTLLITQQPSFSGGSIVKEGLYDPTEYTSIYNIAGKGYQGVGVPYDSPIKNLQDMIAASKKKQLSICGAGIGAISFINATLLTHKSGANLVYVPFNSSAEAVMAGAGSQVDLVSTSYPFFLPLEKQKKLRLIATTGPERAKYAPHVPTAKEQGVPIVLDHMCGFYAPKGLPDDILKVLVAAFEKVVKDEAFLKACRDAKLELSPMGPEEFALKNKQTQETLMEIAPLLTAAAKKKKK